MATPLEPADGSGIRPLLPDAATHAAKTAIRRMQGALPGHHRDVSPKRPQVKAVAHPP